MAKAVQYKLTTVNYNKMNVTSFHGLLGGYSSLDPPTITLGVSSAATGGSLGPPESGM